MDEEAVNNEILTDGASEETGEAVGGMQLKIENFEGPFDLLLALLDKNKIEITDIKISEIADRYLDVIFAAGGFNVDIGSEFLVMASSLIHMKTRKLLPKPLPESTEMTEEELQQHLEIYKKYKEVAESLNEKYIFWSNALYREQETLEFAKKEEAINLSAEELIFAYERVAMKYATLRNDNTEKMEVILKTERVSLKDKIKQVVRFLKGKIKVKFDEIFTPEKSSKPERVTGFLAILELGRRDKVTASQVAPFADIELQGKTDDIDVGDMNLEDYDEWGD